jgi:hypothetical protein
MRKGKGGIRIDPKNEGKFTENARRAGVGVQEYATEVLRPGSRASVATRKQANFARNASKWDRG